MVRKQYGTVHTVDVEVPTAAHTGRSGWLIIAVTASVVGLAFIGFQGSSHMQTLQQADKLDGGKDPGGLRFALSDK